MEEETLVHALLQDLARRETSELPQRLSLLQAKRDRQARLLADKHELLALC